MSRNKLLFRVDAGEGVGLGHFFRSLSIAKSLEKLNYEVIFCHMESKFWVGQHMVSNHFELQGTKNELVRYIRTNNIRLLYVDGLIDFSKSLFNEISKICPVVFQQNITSSKTHCNVFILPGIHYSKEFIEELERDVLLHKGLDYVVLNEEVLNLSPKHLPVNVKKVGITTGGSDPVNVMMRLYEILDFEIQDGIEWYFLYGNDYMHTETIPSQLPENIYFEEFDWQKLYQCDLALSTFGVTIYELMYLGIPTVSIGHAINNAIASNVVESETRSIIDLGFIDDLNDLELNVTIKALIADNERRVLISERAKHTIDGKGLERVVNLVKNLIQ